MLKGITAIFACLFLLSGCNTVAGFGEDVEAGGSAIERGAESAKAQL